MIMNAWRGVYSAITTKLDGQEIDLKAVRADVAFQIEAGVHGIICCGSLGEASTLEADEKIAVAEAAQEAADGRVPVMLTIAEDFDPRRSAPRGPGCGDQPRWADGAAGHALRLDAARDDRPFPRRRRGVRSAHHDLQQSARLSGRRHPGDARRDGGRADASSRSRNPPATYGGSPTSSTSSATATPSSPASTTSRSRA